MSRLRYLVLPAILLVLCGLQIKRAGELIRAQRLLWAVEARTLAMIRTQSLQRPIVDAHLRALTDAARLDPGEVAIRVAIASQHFLRGDYASALSAYRVAFRLERRPEILLNIGKTHQMMGRKEQAIHSYARALRLDPALRLEIPEEYRARVSKALRRQYDPDGAQKDRQVDPE